MTNCRCQGIACETEDREHVAARDPAWLRSNAPSNTSATSPHWCGGRRRDLPQCRWAVAGLVRASRHEAWLRCPREQEHHRHPYFARNLSRSFFETPQKRCNSNDANSMFEQAAGELRAKLMGGGGAWPRCRWVAAGPGRASRSTTPSAARVWRSRGRAAAHRHTQRPGPTKQPGPTDGPSGARNTSGATSSTAATTRENKNRRSRRICGFIVREGGVEPPLHHWNTDLNRARLPIPPLARTQKE